MSATLDPTLDPWADEVYVAALEPRRRGPVGRLVVSVLDLWCATNGGTFELTRAGDVVVRRRADGVEELRVPVQAADDAVLVLDEVREQLAASSPSEFRSAWGLA